MVTVPQPEAAPSMLEYALGYLMDRKPIFPVCFATGKGRCLQHGACTNPGKLPLVAWKRYQTELPTEADVARWWGGSAQANIGMATGELSGVVVLDTDSGDAWKEALRRGIPNTPSVRTGKAGGCHFHFRHPGVDVSNFAGKLAGIDFRGDGGYVLLPPSQHAAGPRYRWIEGTQSQEHAAVPEWLMALLTGPAGTDGTVNQDHVPLDLEQILRGIPEGQRDDTIWRYACKLRGDDVPRDYAEMLVRQAARSCRPPFNETAAAEKVQRAYREFQPTPVLDVPTGSMSLPGHEAIDPDLQPHDVDVPGRPCTQLGNSERLIDQFGSSIRYCYPWKSWLTWDGRRWQRDSLGQVTAWAKEVVRNIYLEARDAAMRQQRNALGQWARRSEAAAQINAMIDLARSAVPVDPTEFDASPWLLNVRNGTVDLRTGLLQEHRQSDNLTKIVDLDYDPDAQCPRWEAFLERVLPDPDVRAFFQRAAGYSASGSARERKLIIPHGPGRNGKSVALQTLKNVLGEYAISAPSETFMAKRDGTTPNDIASLLGARFVFASETNEGHRLDESVIKKLTGGEEISARFLYAEWFSFLPTFTPWLATNHRPVIRGSDHAIWDRIALVPFNVRIPDEEQDADLLDKLKLEYPGILAWVLRGVRAWLDQGLGLPEAVSTATGAYRAEMDALGLFLSERCIDDPDPRTGWVTTGVLYGAYTKWCEDSGERAVPKRALGMRLQERGYEPTRVGSQQARGWLGLRLLSDTEDMSL